MTTNIPDWVLEQYALGELPAARMKDIREQLARDSGLQARLQALETSNAEITQAYPAKKLAAAIRARHEAAEPRNARAPWFRSWQAYSLAAAAVTLMLIWPLARNWQSPGDEGIRMKGGAESLYIYRKTAHRIDLLRDRDFARPGDLLQILYMSRKDTYGLVLSLDGRGKVTLHFPASPQAAARLTRNQKTPLPSAYELDDAPDFERFFFVTAPADINTAQVMEAAHRLAAQGPAAQTKALALGKPFHQQSILVKKGE